MKVCPQCKAQYVDDTLSFCLQDGTPLVSGPQADTPTVIMGETETFVARSSYPLHTPAPSEVTRVQTLEHPKAGSNTALAVVLTAGGMLLLFIVIGTAAWLFTRNSGSVVANANTNTYTPPTLNTNLSPSTSSTNTNVQSSPVPTVSMPQANTNVNTNTPPPVVPDEGASRTEVSQRVYGWKSSMESRDLNSYMANYASTLDRYYTKSGVSSSTVRADKARAFGMFNSMRANISNMDVSVNGDTATATFDKEWNFSGEASNSGKVRSQLIFKRINGRWLITTERDIRVYYTR